MFPIYVFFPTRDRVSSLKILLLENRPPFPRQAYFPPMRRKVLARGCLPSVLRDIPHSPTSRNRAVPPPFPEQSPSFFAEKPARLRKNTSPPGRGSDHPSKPLEESAVFKNGRLAESRLFHFFCGPSRALEVFRIPPLSS